MDLTDAGSDVALLHDHRFLGQGHEAAEMRTWAVIALCAAMMVLEIVGGWLFGSIALIADGLHMSTHAGALLLAAVAYTYGRRHADDPRFTFGTGKLGDLAGFTSAIALAMIAVLIAWDAISRFWHPVPIRFSEALPIAAVGLAVNVASAWLLSGAHRGRDHGHGDHHAHGHQAAGCHGHDGDNNLRAALVHVAADAAVSVLVIVGLLLAAIFGWTWTDPVAGLVGALVIASWSYTLVRDTGAILLDMNPDRPLAARMRACLESDGDRLLDLHLWRLGPGHLGGIVSIGTRDAGRDIRFYRDRLREVVALSHLTVEVNRLA